MGEEEERDRRREENASAEGVGARERESDGHSFCLFLSSLSPRREIGKLRSRPLVIAAPALVSIPIAVQAMSACCSVHSCAIICGKHCELGGPFNRGERRRRRCFLRFSPTKGEELPLLLARPPLPSSPSPPLPPFLLPLTLPTSFPPLQKKKKKKTHHYQKHTGSPRATTRSPRPRRPRWSRPSASARSTS